MNWKAVFRNLMGEGHHTEARHAKRPKRTSSRPATAEPNYVCENCGMLVETLHKHTREECGLYLNDPNTADMRLVKTMMDKTKGRNDPKI